jgi:hypothetical protein
VVKEPDAEGVQRTESCKGEGIIFNISEMVEGLKRKNSRVEFQLEEEGRRRSEIDKG